MSSALNTLFNSKHSSLIWVLWFLFYKEGNRFKGATQLQRKAIKHLGLYDIRVHALTPGQRDSTLGAYFRKWPLSSSSSSFLPPLLPSPSPPYLTVDNLRPSGWAYPELMPPSPDFSLLGPLRAQTKLLGPRPRAVAWRVNGLQMCGYTEPGQEWKPEAIQEVGRIPGFEI